MVDEGVLHRADDPVDGRDLPVLLVGGFRTLADAPGWMGP